MSVSSGASEILNGTKIGTVSKQGVNVMNMRKKFLAIRGVLSVLLLVGGLGTIAHAQQVLLTGTITSDSGEKMEGVTVSARRIGATFTTSVFTDASGQYFF